MVERKRLALCLRVGSGGSGGGGGAATVNGRALALDIDGVFVVLVVGERREALVLVIAPPPGSFLTMAPLPACPSGSVSAAIAPPSESSPTVARGFDLTGVSSVVPSERAAIICVRCAHVPCRRPSRTMTGSLARREHHTPSRLVAQVRWSRSIFRSLEERHFCRDPSRPQRFFSARTNLRHPVNELLTIRSRRTMQPS